jgi:hypothetical protein
MTDKPKEYVAYTDLGDKGHTGEVVNPANWSLEEWKYMVEHQVVVPKNSPNDPNVLEEQAEEARITGDLEAAKASGQEVVSPTQLEAEKAHAAAAGTKEEDSSKEEPKADSKEESKAPAPMTPPTPVKPPATPVKPDDKK